MVDKYKKEKGTLDEYLDTLSDKIRRNTTIVTPDDFDYPYMLHISKDTNIRKFVPRIGERQGKQEDRTVPRICVGNTLANCFSGYAVAEDEVYESKYDLKNFKNGWKIYGFEYSVALKPNKKLVYDADVTNECWLISYSSDTADYQPITLGKVFISEMRIKMRTKEKTFFENDYYIDVRTEKGIPWVDGIDLEKGYWKISGPAVAGNVLVPKASEYAVQKLTPSEYNAQKTLTAGLLSHTEVPAFAKW